jgi:hypothetical protein
VNSDVRNIKWHHRFLVVLIEQTQRQGKRIITISDKIRRRQIAIPPGIKDRRRGPVQGLLELLRRR